MINYFHIYLAGGMSNLAYSEQIRWREKVSKYFFELGHTLVKCISPPDYYNFENPTHKSEREVFEFDTYKVRYSDLIICNFNEPKSIGTAMELMLAKELKIPIIGLNENNYDLHPWLVECCTRIFEDMCEMLEYIKDYYLT